MKKLDIIKYIVVYGILLYTQCARASFEVSELYVEATGNNNYESEIKAHHQGMQRAFLLIADKLAVSADDIADIPYLRLKSVFEVAETKNVTESDDTYKATVTYRYDLYGFDKLLFDYGNSTVKDRFYEYLVLPVFKQKNILTLWRSTQEWHKKWSNSRLILDQAKLFYPKPSADLMQQIRSDNILTLTHSNFIDLFPSVLIKKVMIIICEYFTNIDSGAAVMGVKYVIIDHDGRTTIQKDYPLHNLQEVMQKIDSVFIDTVSSYGRFVNNSDKDMLLASNTNQPKSISVPTKMVEDDVRTIVLNLEAFSHDELNRIKIKLQNVKDIEHWSIDHNYNEKYKVTILTKSNDYQLAESLYLNKLSFRMYGNLYSLIDVINDGS